ncbi:hypothetical protein JANAI61_37320 [Jannaschia sp. AI_61]|nr:hypothetical protein JANAI61_37320 [Jannaschia sp. AI_61]
MLVAILMLVASLAQSGATLRVETPAGLRSALAQARPGTVIELAGGEYGKLEMRRARFTAAAPLILRSQTADDPARFSGLDMRRVAHVTLDGVVFDYTFAPGDRLRHRPFQMRDITGVTIRRALFDGDVARGLGPADNGFGSGFGFWVRGGTGLTIEASEIRGFYKGIIVNTVDDVVLRGNDLHSLRMDGMNLAAVQGVRIEDNAIHNFRRSPNSKDHADMIQFWTKGTDRPSRDVVIRDNLLASGDGLFTQSIFIRNQEVDQGRAGRAMFYRNFTIEQNIILNAHLHGITVGETEGLVIRNNTLARNARSVGPRDSRNLYTPTIRVAEGARDVTIQANVTPRIVGYDGQPSWRVARNFTIQHEPRGRGGFYGAVFTGDPAVPAGFGYRLGGQLDGAGLGAGRLQP